MLSVVTSFHWFSDIVSGAILGIIIGKYFQINQNYESNY
jgi:membrane-associated phospholipid phosphatase